MTDHELEQRLRDWYLAEVGDRPAAPELLRQRVAAIPTTQPASTRRLGGRPGLTLLVAATLLIGGALTVGAGLLRLSTIVPPAPSYALIVAPLPSTSETPTATASPPASPKAWITGQQLADLLSREYGYKWISVHNGDGQTTLRLDVPPTSPITIQISPPSDSRATVYVGSDLTEASGANLLVDSIAEALAPDSSAWIRGAIARGVGAGAFDDATDTANGGSVGIEVVDEPIIRGWMRVWFSPEPLPKPRSEPIANDAVVYADSGLIRVVNPDGTDDGALLISDWRVPGSTSVARVLGWSPDGSRLLFFDGIGNLMSTDAMGSKPTLIGRAARTLDPCTKLSDTAQRAKCESDLGGPRDRELCASLTEGGTCEIALADVLLSSDGTRLAYSISDDGHDMMAFFDIATGQVTRVEFESAGGRACNGPFGGGPLQWSPDGTRFVFGNSVGPRVGGWCQGAVFTINADGTDPRRITPKTVHAMEPRWSPDGSTIVFSSSTPRSAWNGKGDATRIPVDSDVYSVRPDGSGLTVLTSDGVSFEPFSTRDGRILYSRSPQRDGNTELWVMDADGQNATRVDPTISAMTAAGCAVCPFPDALRRSDQGESDGSDGGPGTLFWRPEQP